MNASNKNPSFEGCLTQILIAVLGLIFFFFIFLFLFAGDHRAAVIAEIIFVTCGFITCYLLSIYSDKSWYFWSLPLSLPMTCIGLLSAWGLMGGKQVGNDILIFASSGFFVLIGSSIGGYLGKKRKRKSGMDNIMTINLPSTDKPLQCIYISRQGQVDIYITHHEELPTYIQLINHQGDVLSTEQTQTVNGTVKVSINITDFLNRIYLIRVFNSDGISVQIVSEM